MFPLFCKTVEEDAEPVLPGSWLNEVLEFVFGFENQRVPATPLSPHGFSWLLQFQRKCGTSPTVSVTLLMAEVTEEESGLFGFWFKRKRFLVEGEAAGLPSGSGDRWIFWCSARFPLLIQPWTPAHRKRSPTFRVGLPSSPDPHRHAQRLVCLLGEARFCQVDSRY